MEEREEEREEDREEEREEDREEERRHPHWHVLRPLLEMVNWERKGFEKFLEG